MQIEEDARGNRLKACTKHLQLSCDNKPTGHWLGSSVEASLLICSYMNKVPESEQKRLLELNLIAHGIFSKEEIVLKLCCAIFTFKESKCTGNC